MAENVLFRNQTLNLHRTRNFTRKFQTKMLFLHSLEKTPRQKAGQINQMEKCLPYLNSLWLITGLMKPQISAFKQLKLASPRSLKYFMVQVQ